ncbi:hypothetical protein RHGRI_002747 [Rhododendron griersonianum]|uniref:Uncharacterized protein n=1 Tax=Rhododendron griersonianum TaxID=479676 RepID=A0AAV6LRE8_9ERIC|nr:hypothetical protein RHGRI_002747 [Rhododendron griersonianum]
MAARSQTVVALYGYAERLEYEAASREVLEYDRKVLLIGRKVKVHGRKVRVRCRRVRVHCLLNVGFDQSSGFLWNAISSVSSCI